MAIKHIANSDGSISDTVVKKAIKSIRGALGSITDAVVKKAIKIISDSDGSISDRLVGVKATVRVITDVLGRPPH